MFSAFQRSNEIHLWRMNIFFHWETREWFINILLFPPSPQRWENLGALGLNVEGDTKQRC